LSEEGTVKQCQGFGGIVFGGAAALIAIQPAFAAPARVTAVQLKPTAAGVDVVLQTQAGEAPQVFAVNRGNSWTADVTNTQLRLPNSSEFSQSNPANGISSVTVAPLDGNSIRVTVVGQKGAPIGKITRSSQGGLILNLSRSTKPGPAAAAAAPTTRFAQVQTPPPAPATPPAPGTQVVPAVPATPSSPDAPLPNPAPPLNGTPLLPNPQVTIQQPIQTNVPGVPPTLPRPVAPPVGDMTSAQVDASSPSIDLGSAERIPRLVLRDAPAREVLSLLARAAGLNIAFTAEPGTGPQAQQPQQPGADTEGPRITLDIENESVQDVFNYVLRIANLEANRVGRTVFVARRLPNTARSLSVRSVRLNQVPVTSALNFLVSLGAESAVSRERLITSVNAVPVAQLAGGAGQAITQTQTTTEQRIEVQRVEYIDSVPILRGLQVSGDERTNMLTLVGSPRQIDIALNTLTQLDVRRRQVVVNVRVIDVDLLALEQASSSFSFGIDDTRVINQGGIAVVNFGSTANRAPAVTGLQGGTTGLNTIGSVVGVNPINGTATFDFFRNFLLQLQASIARDDAKILTDPTLLVQEGQTATVNVTQEVVTNVTQQTTFGQNTAQTTITVEKGRAGLILGVRVDRIDDNGFISLSVAPSISRPSGALTVNIPGAGANQITLLAERRLETGQVRLRDGQTLLLTGVIQDQDRATIQKIPILGDIPILGALFRRTDRRNERREVIIMLTPRVLDDSDRSTFGYTYTPGSSVQQVIEQQNRR
jgi:type IV pilus assembly protein PilQ